MSDLFVSYSRTDTAFVRGLTARLTAAGREVWVDWEDIPPSADWFAEVEAGIEGADAFVAVLSPEALASPVCARELAHAARHGKRVIPVLHRDVPPGEVPDALSRPNWVLMREGDDEAAALAALDRALDDDLEWARAHTRLLVRAIEWDARGRDASRVLRGSDLREAEARLAAPPGDPAPTALQREYVRAGRVAATRRGRIVLASVSVALAVSVVLGLLALWQRGRAIDERDTARSRELTARATSLLDVDPQEAVGLAVQAAGRKRTPEAVDALSEALLRARAIAALPARGGRLAGVSRDARTVLLVGRDGVVQVWRPDDDAARPAAVLGDPSTPATAAALSPDGAAVVTGGRDGARLWSADGRPGRALDAGAVVAAAFSDDGRRLLTVAQDGSAAVWTAPAGRLVAPLPPGGGRAALSGDGTVALTWGGRAGAAWDARTGALLRVLDAPDAAAGAVAADGTRVALGLRDGRASVWDLRGGGPPRTLRGHRGQLTAAAFSPDGRQLLTAGIDGTARLWPASAGRPAIVLRAGAGPVVAAAFSADGRRVVTAGDDGAGRVWDARTGALRAVLAGAGGNLLAAALRADGDVAVTAAYDGEVRTWDAARDAARWELAGHAAPVVGVAFAPDGRRLLTVSFDGTARLWADGRAAAVLPGHAGPVQAGAVSGVDGSVVTGGWDGTVRLWSATGAPRQTIRAHDGVVYAVAVSDDGRRMLSAGADGVADVRDARTGARVARVAPGAGALVAAAFDPAGERIAAAGDDGVARVWRIGDPDPVATLRGHRDRIVAVRFTPDGRRLLTASLDGTARLWDLARPGAAVELRTPAQVVDAAVSPDGRVVATAGQDALVRLWDARTGAQLRELEGHDAPVVAVRFSPDGRRVASASEDGSARVWGTASGHRLARFAAAREGLVAVAFSPDGERIATGGLDGIARVFACDRCDAMEDPLALAGR